jgi:putative membrane protein
MQIVRTIIWVLLLVGLLVFSFANWEPTITLHIWPGLVVDTKIPVVVIITFLIGFLPTWMYLRGAKWKLHRRIHSLELAARNAAVVPAAAPEATTVVTTPDEPVNSAPVAEFPSDPRRPLA